MGLSELFGESDVSRFIDFTAFSVMLLLSISHLDLFMVGLRIWVHMFICCIMVCFLTSGLIYCCVQVVCRSQFIILNISLNEYESFS